VAVLALAAALYRGRGRGLTATLALVAFVATAAAYLLHPAVLALLASWALVIAVGALASRGRPRPSAAAVVIAALPLALIVFLLALSVVLARLPEGSTTVVRSPSPDGRWIAVTTTVDPGAMGSVSSTVVVSGDLTGLVQVRRIVYEGSHAQPRWVRSSVLQLPTARVDVMGDDALTD